MMPIMSRFTKHWIGTECFIRNKFTEAFDGKRSMLRQYLCRFNRNGQKEVLHCFSECYLYILIWYIYKCEMNK